VGWGGPLGELIARAVTNNLYRFVVPALAGPAMLVPLASLVGVLVEVTDPPILPGGRDTDRCIRRVADARPGADYHGAA
jgi:hypothetical protein